MCVYTIGEGGVKASTYSNRDYHQLVTEFNCSHNPKNASTESKNISVFFFLWMITIFEKVQRCKELYILPP